jgi:hypothetical protein
VNRLLDVVFHASVWRAMHGVPIAIAVVIAVAVGLSLLMRRGRP